MRRTDSILHWVFDIDKLLTLNHLKSPDDCSEENLRFPKAMLDLMLRAIKEGDKVSFCTNQQESYSELVYKILGTLFATQGLNWLEYIKKEDIRFREGAELNKEGRLVALHKENLGESVPRYQTVLLDDERIHCQDAYDKQGFCVIHLPSTVVDESVLTRKAEQFRADPQRFFQATENTLGKEFITFKLGSGSKLASRRKAQAQPVVAALVTLSITGTATATANTAAMSAASMSPKSLTKGVV
jgi:hypothetical protein